MAYNLGKAFEQKFKENFLATVPNSSVDRLYDPVGGYKAITNICDFICYKEPNIFYIECKSHKGNTFPFSCLTQYEKLLSKIGIPGVRVGVILWMIEKDVVVYLPLSTIRQMKDDGKKSFNVYTDLFKNKVYNIIEIPSIKKRTFMNSDYIVLTTLKENE